jgi:hypothetical protein
MEESSNTSCTAATTASDNLPEEYTAKRKVTEEDLERSRNVRHKSYKDDSNASDDGSILLEAILPVVVVVDKMVPLVENPKQLEAKPVTVVPKEEKVDNEIPLVKATKHQAADEIENEPMVVGNVNTPASKQPLIEVYLVNTEKFHAIDTIEKEFLQFDEDYLNNKDSQARETAHRIIQCRVR